MSDLCQDLPMMVHRRKGDVTFSRQSLFGRQEFSQRVFHGWLWKRSKRYMTWKKRYFLLHGMMLTYYPQACVIYSKRGACFQCVTTAPVGGLRVESAEASKLTEFGIKITSCSNRILYVQAEDAACQEQWLHAFQKAIQTACTPSPGPGGHLSATFCNDEDDDDDESESLETNEFASSSSSSLPSTESGSLPPPNTEASVAEQGWVKVRSSPFWNWQKRFLQLRLGSFTLTKFTRRQGVKEAVTKPLAVVSVHPSLSNPTKFYLILDDNRTLQLRTPNQEGASRWITAIRCVLGTSTPHSCVHRAHFRD